MSRERDEVEVRPLREADLERAFEIAQSLKAAPDWPRHFYVEALQPESSRRRIALAAADRRSGELIGFTVASLIPPEAELESIAVVAPGQRCGVGRQLLAALVEELQRAGVEALLLEVRASNLAAIRFYESQNFKQIGVRKRYYADPEEDAILMSLQIL